MYVFDADLNNILPPGGHCPAPVPGGHCHLMDVMIESSAKGSYTILSIKLLQNEGEGNTYQLHEQGPTVAFLLL